MLLNYHIGRFILQRWRGVGVSANLWCLVVCDWCDVFCRFVVASNVFLLMLTVATFYGKK